MGTAAAQRSTGRPARKVTTPAPPRSRALLRLAYPAAVLALLLLILAAYGRSFSGVTLMDDKASILENLTIRHLGWSALAPPNNGTTVTGRPLLNFTFAIDWAIGGADVTSYHCTNLLIHMAAALALLGIVRRTLRLPFFAEPWQRASTGLALAVAGLWALHPLQTESITYIVQRAESLMGLMYLLTLYCVVRAATGSKALVWTIAATVACFAGMASKEVMVSAPLVALLYDRTFLAGSFKGALRRRWRIHLALAASWILLGWLVIHSWGRSNTAGLGLQIGWWPYVRTQAVAIVRYLKLSVWPSPLVFDYGFEIVHSAWWIIAAVVVLALAAAGIFALLRRHAAGVPAAAFFFVLAPTVFVPVVTQTIAEHRMYLPLAAVFVLLVCGASRWSQRAIARGRLTAPAAGRLLGLACTLVAVVFGMLTFERNALYATPGGIWGDTVAKVPNNDRAQQALGNHYLAMAQFELARQHYARAAELDPTYPSHRETLGGALMALGRHIEAEPQYRKAVELAPQDEVHYLNLGHCLSMQGRFDEAVDQYRKAIEIKPLSARAWADLGEAYLKKMDPAQAMTALTKSLELDASNAETNYRMGNAQFLAVQTDAAIASWRRATALNPRHAMAYGNLGTVLLRQGKLAEAIEALQSALRCDPSLERTRIELEQAMARRPGNR